MKKILTGAAYSLVFLGVALIFAALIFGKNNKQAVNTKPPTKLFSIVRLVGADGKTFCSGTVINATTVITAAHCVPDSTGIFVIDRPIEIRAYDNIPRNTTAKVLRAIRQMDQAVLQGDFKDYTARPYITKPDTLAKIVDGSAPTFMSCGYPLHGDLYCRYVLYIKPNIFAWAVRGQIFPGMSGGPTMLLDGTVVAINVAVDDELSIVSPIYNIYPESK